MNRRIAQTLFVAMLGCFTAYAQNDVSSRLTDIESRIKTLSDRIAAMEVQVSKVTAENTYLREALRIGKPIREYTSPDNIRFALTSLVGNAADNTVTANMLVTNESAKNIVAQYFLGKENGSAIDVEGDTFYWGNVSMGGDSFVNDLMPAVPVKAYVVFEGVPNTSKIMKAIRMSMISEYGEKNFTILFKDVPIEWR